MRLPVKYSVLQAAPRNCRQPLPNGRGSERSRARQQAGFELLRRWTKLTISTVGALMLAGAPVVFGQDQPPACPGLPPGKHSLLERMTAQFGLTCDQELKIEPLLHLAWLKRGP